MKKIYLASPYSHADPAIVLARFSAVNRAAAALIKEGNFVFSPISHTHPIAEAGDLPLGFDFWAEYDKTFITWADEVHVLMQDGYIDSVGVNAEIQIAKEMNKPICYMHVI